MTEAEALRERDTIGLLRGNDAFALAVTMIAEAAGDRREGGSSIEERIAVACAIRNRLKQPRRWGSTYGAIVQQPLQFSCWNFDDPNRAKILKMGAALTTGQPVTDLLLVETIYLARGIIDGIILDIVGGADHYFNPKVVTAPAWSFMDPKTRTRPRPRTAIVGSHEFLNA